MDVIEVWAAHGDGGDERSTGPVIGYCRTEAQAREFAKGKGWYGGNGVVLKKPAIFVEGEYWLLEERNPIDLDNEQARRDKQLRDETIAGLSKEQRRVLGIDV